MSFDTEATAVLTIFIVGLVIAKRRKGKTEKRRKRSTTGFLYKLEFTSRKHFSSFHALINKSRSIYVFSFAILSHNRYRDCSTSFYRFHIKAKRNIVLILFKFIQKWSFSVGDGF